jgi:hypothetical protein
MDDKKCTVYSSEKGKSGHTIYKYLRDITSETDYDVNILGIDENALLKKFPKEAFDKNFFFYTESVVNYNPNHLDIIEHDNFRGFITHLSKTCSILWDMYKKPVFKLDLGIFHRTKDEIDFIKKHIKKQCFSRDIKFLSTTTYNDTLDSNFLNRGGAISDILMQRLLDNEYNVRLTHKGQNRFNFSSYYPENLTLIQNYISDREMHDLFLKNSFYLLPSVQVHAASLTMAMSYGLIPVISEGYGFEEYCSDFNSIRCFSYPDSIIVNQGINQDNISFIDYAEIDASFFVKFDELYYDREKLYLFRMNSLGQYISNYSPYMSKIGIENIFKQAIT